MKVPAGEFFSADFGGGLAEGPPALPRRVRTRRPPGSMTPRCG